MSSLRHVPTLSEKDKELCNTIGGIGLVISVVCLCQQLYSFETDMWVSWLFFIPFFFCITAFTLLIAKKPAAALCIAIGSGLLFLYEATWIFMYFYYGYLSFSVLVLLLLIFMICAAVYIYMAELNYKIKGYHRHKMEEEQFWGNKI